MPLTVRTATPADVPVIVDYNRRLARETEHKSLDPATVSAGVAAAIADPTTKGPYYLACDGADVVGQLQVEVGGKDDVPEPPHLIGPESQRPVGAHLDAGPAVLVVRGGDHRHRLYVERENTPAQSTYSRLGMAVLPYMVLEEALTPGYELPK